MMNLTLIVMDEEELFIIYFLTSTSQFESVCFLRAFITHQRTHTNFNQTLAAILSVLEFVGSQHAVAARYKLASSILYQWWAKLYGKSHKYAYFRTSSASLPLICPMMTLRVSFHSITQLLSSNKTSSFTYFYVIYNLHDARYKRSTYHTAYKPRTG